MDTKTAIAGFIGAAIAAGGFLTVDTAQLEKAQEELADVQADKMEILKDYVYAQVRLNEIPALDLNTASTEEMSKAYTGLINEKQTPTGGANLFIDLYKEAEEQGLACK